MNTLEYAKIMGLQHRSVRDLIVKNNYDLGSEIKIKSSSPLGGRPTVAYELSESAIIRLASSSRSSTPERLAKLSSASGVDLSSVDQVSLSRTESVFFEALQVACSILHDVSVKAQYKCLGYNIDYAITRCGSILLIECDEPYHKLSSMSDIDIERESDITAKLLGEFDSVYWFRFDSSAPIAAISHVCNLLHTDTIFPVLLSGKVGGYNPEGLKQFHRDGC